MPGRDRPECSCSVFRNEWYPNTYAFAGNLVRHPCFDAMRASGEGYRVVGMLERTDRIMRDTFWVGVYPGMTDQKLLRIADAIREAATCCKTNI